MMCDCGIRLRQWNDLVFYCPRCREVFVVKDEPDDRPMVYKGEAAKKIVVGMNKALKTLLKEAIADPTPADPPPRPTSEVKTVVQGCVINGKRMIPCLVCGELIEDRCGAVCKCGFIKPCDLPH